MALESNVMELISPAAAAIPGTVSATLSRLSTWRGEDADGAFDERIDALAGSVDPDAAARVTVERIDMGNPAACYWSVSGESLGRSIRARLGQAGSWLASYDPFRGRWHGGPRP